MLWVQSVFCCLLVWHWRCEEEIGWRTADDTFESCGVLVPEVTGGLCHSCCCLLCWLSSWNGSVWVNACFNTNSCIKQITSKLSPERPRGTGKVSFPMGPFLILFSVWLCSQDQGHEQYTCSKFWYKCRRGSWHVFCLDMSTQCLNNLFETYLMTSHLFQWPWTIFKVAKKCWKNMESYVLHLNLCLLRVFISCLHCNFVSLCMCG